MEEIAYYPITDILDSGHLDVGDGHQIYWQTMGNPKGKPIVLLHGGPGDNISESKPALLNPEKYYIIAFDQRGCGKSTPFASTENNTTPHLISDIEQLREHLKIDTWFVQGSSWGAALGLAYADQHPDKIEGLVFNGIYLGRQEETDSLFGQEGIVSQIYPDYYEPFITLLPEDKRDNPIQGYGEMFRGQDEELKREAVKKWQTLETIALDIVVPPEFFEEEMADEKTIFSLAILEQHYMANNCFMDGDTILKTIGDKLKGKVVHLIQGRYDMICPMKTAWEVHKAIPNSHLHIIADAGHLGKDPATQRKLIEVFDQL